MGNQNITLPEYRTIEFHGLLISTQVNDYTAARPAPLAQTPDSPGFDDEGDAEEIDYCATTDIAIDCADSFIDWLNLEENEEFREKVLEEMRK